MKTNRIKSCRALVAAFVALALASGCSGGAQATPPAAMGSAPPPPVLFDGAERVMNLAAVPAASGLSDGPLALAQGAPLISAQTGRKPAPVDGRSHLRLAVKLTEAGQVELTRAVVVEGPVLAAQEPIGSYVSEVIDAQGVRVALESITDPFEVRGFPAPMGSLAPPAHAISRAAEAVVVVKVPAAAADGSKLEGLRFRFFRLKAGEQLEALDDSTIDRLIAAGKLELKAELPAARFGAVALAKLGGPVPADGSSAHPH